MLAKTPKKCYNYQVSLHFMKGGGIMLMKARMTAKDWLNSLNREQLEKVCSLKNNPAFIEFMAKSDVSTLMCAHYASECLAVGVPVEYTATPEALHFLTVAIANYLNGNA